IWHHYPLLIRDTYGLRYQVLDYTPPIIHSYEQRLATIWSRPVNWIHLLNFEGITDEMRQDLALRLRRVYTGEQGMDDSVMKLDTPNTL
ncbi:hypothetical protein Tco_1083849, partial [Tanacetum coccineum]